MLIRCFFVCSGLPPLCFSPTISMLQYLENYANLNSNSKKVYKYVLFSSAAVSFMLADQFDQSIDVKELIRSAK